MVDLSGTDMCNRGPNMEGSLWGARCSLYGGWTWTADLRSLPMRQWSPLSVLLCDDWSYFLILVPT